VSYSTAFNTAVARVLESEGGYVNDPNDPGGETNFGISKRSYPNEDIRGMTAERATEIYFRDYWQAVRGDDLSFPVAIVLFDCAVNQGVKTAIRLLQGACKVTEDGVIGPATIAAADVADPLALAGRFLRRRVLAYSDLKGWANYRASWVQRCFDAYRVACEGGLG
jgi:lysozyme family protein